MNADAFATSRGWLYVPRRWFTPRMLAVASYAFTDGDRAIRDPALTFQEHWDHPHYFWHRPEGARCDVPAGVVVHLYDDRFVIHRQWAKRHCLTAEPLFKSWRLGSRGLAVVYTVAGGRSV